jgi:hypothetical protein
MDALPPRRRGRPFRNPADERSRTGSFVQGHFVEWGLQACHAGVCAGVLRLWGRRFACQQPHASFPPPPNWSPAYSASSARCSGSPPASQVASKTRNSKPSWRTNSATSAAATISSRPSTWLVEALFWFHPLVWWLGARLEEERERACDEEVVRLGGEPQVYAESILKVVEFYLASPVACAAGVTGGELKKRIEGIMSNPFTRKLSYGKKILLAVAAMVAVAGPIAIGFTTLVAQMLAQSGAVRGGICQDRTIPDAVCER